MERGEVVQLGQHRLMCGDAFNPEHVDALMQGEKVDMLYCDPLYGMGLDATYRGRRNWDVRRPGGSLYRNGDQGWQKIADDVAGDANEFNPLPIISLFEECREQFWWGADYYRHVLPSGGSWIVWDKRLTEKQDRAFGLCFELCWSRQRHQRTFARILWSGLLGWWNDCGRKRVHPTQKPTALAEWFLSRYSKPNAIVVDLFAGSGSTLLACERMGRRARVMEIDPHYCQVIIDRYQALTRQPKLPLTA